MKPRLQLIFWMIISGLLFFLSCEGDKDVIYDPTNKAPIAKAGPDQITFLPKDSIVLDGAASTDPDGTIEKYLWSKIEGPASFIIVNPNASRTSVRSLVQGTYRFELQITDNRGAKAKDTVEVVVNSGSSTNQPPVAHAGADQIIILPTNSCTLDGSGSYDPDGSLTEFRWTKLTGPESYSIQNTTAMRTSVRNLGAGVYQFELMVTDNSGLTAKDTARVTLIQSSTTACDISNRSRFTATLTEIGLLSEARIPAVAAAGNQIVFAGGGGSPFSKMSVSANVDIYDINTQTWTRAQLSQARGSIAAVSSGNKIFFAGGIDAEGNRGYTNVDIYDAATGRWTVAHLSEARGALAAASVGNKVIFAGGTPNWWQGSNKVDIYDLSSGTWSTAHLSEAKLDIAAVTIGDKVYFGGGEDLGRGYSGVDIYDHTTNRWSTSFLTELNGGVTGVGLGDNIYWSGTFLGQNTAVSKLEIWNTRTGTTTTSCLSYPRYLATAVAHNNNALFFGWQFDLGVSNSFDVYNPESGKWSIGLIDRTIASASLIVVNNTIYMAGGLISSTYLTNKVYKLSW